MLKFDHGDGCYLSDRGEERYLDFTSGGIFASILGNNPQPISKILGSQVMVGCYNHAYDNPWAARYRDMLKEFTGFESVALFTTGAEATEAWWRLIRTYTGLPGVWGGLVDPDEVGDDAPKCDAFHGWTLGALIMAGRLSWGGLGIFPELGEGRFATSPERTGGMIIEPYHAPSAQFHKMDPTINRQIELTKTFPDIPRCIDEIQGGFGRTGKLFAHQWYEGLTTDFVIIGKACGAGLPLSALLGPKYIMEDRVTQKESNLHSTHSGHPIMAAVGCKVIEEIQEHDLIQASLEKGEFLAGLLEKLPIRVHAGKGLLAGLEFKDAETAHAVVMKCQDLGLLVVDTGRKWVKLGPAFVITPEQLEVGVKILAQAVEEILDV